MGLDVQYCSSARQRLAVSVIYTDNVAACDESQGLEAFSTK